MMPTRAILRRIAVSAFLLLACCTGTPTPAPPGAVHIASRPPSPKDLIEAVLASHDTTLKVSSTCASVGTEPTDATIGRYLAGFLAEMQLRKKTIGWKPALRLAPPLVASQSGFAISRCATWMEMTAGLGASAFRCARAMASFCLILSNVPALDDESHSFSRDTLRPGHQLTIAGRSNPQEPDERAPHNVDAAESSSRGDVLEASIRAFEVTTRRLDAHLKHVLGRRRADLASKHALEVSNAHGHPTREVLHRQSRLEMLGNPDLQFTYRRHLG